MNQLRTLGYLYRYFGPGWLTYRVGYTLRMRSGWLKRQMPAVPWDDQPLDEFLADSRLADPQVYLEWRKAHAPNFFFAPSDRSNFQLIFKTWDRENLDPSQEADQLASGIFRYFDHTPMQIGCLPDWHRNPFTGQSTPTDQHWSQIDDFSRGDIKVIWDLSRFGFVYPLVRAYWRTGDDRYAELFWRLVEDWRTHNPPQMGANWMSGQETSFRVMAWCFGLYGFLDSPATTAERVAMLAQMVAISGKRIEANLRHALSQQNNHGVSVGMGLWTIGILFPEFLASARWREKGRTVLESLGRGLIYDDGAFSQHSANYQRLVLHDYLWAIRLGALNHQPFGADLLERVKQAGEFLYQAQDEDSGRLPCFGHNDGSLVLLLNACDYSDYRPILQAISYLTTGERRYPDGAWDEDLLWLFGPAALQSPVKSLPRADFQAQNGGFYTLRAKSGFAFIHCATYHHRPAHADNLNLDLWWRGQNICLDPGTFSYNAPPPWDHALASSMYHNAVTVDGLDQMERVGRFLWLPWVKGSIRSWLRSAKGRLAYWEGEHNGYMRLPHPVRVRRGILQLGDDHWLILDRLVSDREHNFRLQWLLPDRAYTWDGQSGLLSLDLPAGPYHVSLSASAQRVVSLVRADDGSPRGWQSPYYNAREPALSVDCTVRAKSVLFWTLFGPAPCRVDLDQDSGRVDASHWNAQFHLVYDESSTLLQSVTLSGEEPDQLTPIRD